MRTVVALFDRFEDAQQAVHALHESGYGRNDINMIARDVSGEYTRYLDETREGETEDVSGGAAAGAGAGAILGGLGGLLVGLGALAIPGIGPVLAAGPIVTALAGAGVGALAGGMIGALVDLGIPEEHANIYAEGVRRGGTLVVVRAPDAQAEDARSVLNRFNPVDIESRSQTWRDAKWSSFDQHGNELTAEQMEFNRSRGTVPVTGSDFDRQQNRDVTLDQDSDYISRQDQDVNMREGGMGTLDTGTDEWNRSENRGSRADRDVDMGVDLSGSGDHSTHDRSQDVDRTVSGGYSDYDRNHNADRSGSGDIPVTGGEQQRGRDRDEDANEPFESGMNAHLTQDVYGSERTHDDIVDIPVTGARMVTDQIDHDVDAPTYDNVDTDVNNRGWDGFNARFQRDYETRYGSTGYGYDFYQPAYRYGYGLANNPTYYDYDWDRLEPVARQEWQRQGLRGAWEDVKDAVQHAWRTATRR